MKNLVFLFFFNISIFIGYSSNKQYNNLIHSEYFTTSFNFKLTLKKLLDKEIKYYTFDSKNLIIKHCKSIFNNNYYSSINNVTSKNWMNCIALGFTNSTDVQLNNDLNLKNLSASSIIFILLVIIVLLGLWIAILIIRSKKYKNEKKLLRVFQTQNKILQKEFERLELTENTNESSNDLNISIDIIKKVAMLKKQLDNILDEKITNYNEKEAFKKVKVSLNSFFVSHSETAHIVQRRLNIDKIVAFIKKYYPEISEKEVCVIEYIVMHFTTKEIALLMDKSEKSVEYYRSQIRKKIQLTSNCSLEDYINAQVKSKI
jgi:DNA-binding CsgD family transcriptional regulator